MLDMQGHSPDSVQKKVQIYNNCQRRREGKAGDREGSREL